MRVLYVVARIPGADFKGDQVRSYQQIKHLGGRHEITLVSLDTTPSPSTVPQRIRELCSQVMIVRHSRWRTLLGAARALFSGRPFQVEAYCSARLERVIEHELATRQYDLVHIQVARLARICENRRSPPCVIDFVDALSLNMKRRAAHDRGPVGWIAAIEAGRMQRYEQQVLSQVAAAAVSSPIDQAALGHAGTLHLVDNGVDLADFSFSSPRVRDHAIVFVGNLGYFPNVDAVLWFAAAVLPLIRQVYPDVKLVLVGARPHAALHRLAANDANVKLIGPVPRTHPYLSAAAVAIAPMRAGSGQQLKVLEAMATGTPVVLTSSVAASIDADPGTHFLVADSAEDSAHAVCQLLADANLRQRIAMAAHQRVASYYTWQHAAERMERVWQAAVDSRDGSAEISAA